MIRHFRIAAAVVLAAALLWAPLPFGSVTRVGETAVALLSFLVLGWVVWWMPRLGELRSVRWPASALVAMAVLGLLQSVPLPTAVTGLLSPGHLEMTTAAQEGEVEMAPLSVAPAASRRAALRWLALAAVFTAAVAAGLHRLHRRILAGSLFVGAGFQILFGARRWFSSSHTIWGVEVPGGNARLRGTYINPDHLALYLELALVVAFAWGWWALRRARGASSLEQRLLFAVPPILTWLALLAGLAFTGSRGGLVAALLATALQGGLAAAQVEQDGRWRRAGLRGVGVAVAGLGVAVAAALGAREGLSRLLGTSPYELAWNTRTYAYRAVVELWQGFPVFGTGLGTFRDSFPQVQPAALPGEWTHAHNGPLEIAATTGILGLLICLAGVIFLLRGLLLRWFHGVRSEGKAAALAALGGVVAAATHECVDFGLTMPANGLVLAVLCGAALGVPHRRSREEAAGGRE